MFEKGINITLIQRYALCSPMHNRISRKGFITNIFFLAIVLSIGIYVVGIALVDISRYFIMLFLASENIPEQTVRLIGSYGISGCLYWSGVYLFTIQIIKRLHDFGCRSMGLVGTLLLVVLLGVFYRNHTYELYALFITYPLLLLLTYACLSLILVCIPGTKGLNKYGKEFGV